MKILILNWKDIHHPQAGGAEIIVYELAKRLANEGHEVTCFCRSFKDGLPQETIDGINIIRRGNLLTMYLWAPIYYWSLKTKPNLVIDISNTIYWQTPLWAFKSKKVAYLNQLAQDVFYYEYPLLVSRMGILAERLQYLTYKHTKFVCYSNSTKTDLISMGIPSNNISTFSLGLDHERYIPGKKSTTPLFICVSRLVKMKRNDLAIKAMNIVVKKHPETKLVIVGTGYDRRRLESIRNTLNLQNNVFFADENTWFFTKNTKDKKLLLMQQAWSLLFLSVKEGWGMTVTESAASGTPAIVSNVSGLVDSVKKDQTGVVLSKNPSPEEISQAINSLIENKTLRTKLSKNSLAWSTKFSWNTSFIEFKKATGIT